MMLKTPRFVKSSEQAVRRSENSSDIKDEGMQTLRDILLTPLTSFKGRKKIETYTMQNILEPAEKQETKSLIVTRMPLIFNNNKCQVINFSDITTYKRLEKQEQTNSLLKTLMMTVHHSMIGPLKSNLALSMRLIRNLKKNVVMKEAAKSIYITTQMLMLHANDLLDLRIIEQGSFVPTYVESDITEMIMQVIKVVKFTQNDKEL